MIRVALILLCAIVLGVPAPSAAQTAAAQTAAAQTAAAQTGAAQTGAAQTGAGQTVGQPPLGQPGAAASISAEQARAALDVLNDPAKRAAFAATLTAIIKTHPAAAQGLKPSASPGARSGVNQPQPAAAVQPAKPPLPHTVVEGISIPLDPDSLGAQVLLSASAFVNQVGTRTVEAMKAVQSLPLLYAWAVVMATNPIALGILLDVTWRVALVLVCAVAVEYGLRRALQRPIHRLEGQAPPIRPADRQEDPDAAVPGDPDAAGPGDPDEAVPGDPDEAASGDLEALVPADLGAAETEPAVAVEHFHAEDTDAAVARHRPRPSAWTLLRRVPLVIARLVLELVPVFGIVLVGQLIAGSSLGGQTVSRLVILAVVDSYAICAALLCVARMLLSPGKSRLRLFHLRDASAAYLMRWTRRLILVAVFGYAIGEVGLLLGLSDIGHDAFEKFVGLLLHVSLAFIVVQKRHAMARLLRAPPGATGAVAAIRNRFARVWHWVALFFLIASWVAWAIEVPHGFALVIHYFVVTALVLIGARLTLLLLLGVVDRVMRAGTAELDFYAGMRARLMVYHPAVTLALRLFVYVLCVLGLLQLYGLNTFLWLVNSTLGGRILSAVATLTLTIVLALTVWEAVNGGVQQHLDRLQRQAQFAKSARLRTLLPLLRTTLLITISIIAGLMILSEIGINIAPLLAGAGIVGVAIGFGSQKLVQDLITGIFLLLENAMQVGDTVTVSGLTGTVENLSVRTIRLRAGDGSVHIIPFSSVTSVSNTNRGLGNASISVSVAYDEDTDRVADELKAIVAGMRTESDLSSKMLSDFQLWGVDKVDGAATSIVGQVVCTDSGRWPVQREFNRRMKRRFQELGIRIFNPVPTMTVSLPAQAPAEKGDNHGHAQAAD
ncbi:mechanosensitive ion channel domain-containing protein [Rhodopila sp.]|uniref:mechanosensitive ion channel family protein n=1 Tax=Rhodopila sp. TaxID=2480087 RepID=UPI003D0AEA46